MDKSIKRGLNDRVYDKRKAAAQELEAVVRDCIAVGDIEKINLIIKQLRDDYAYAVHQQNARYGGVLALAGVAIALGPNELPYYLDSIMHPILACFGDQDGMVRYFSCEALYNIAKIAKGEILLFFNEIFDVLCKLVADVEINVKNAADILDRLIKDIVSEKAATYVSILQKKVPDEIPNTIVDANGKTLQIYEPQSPRAFSLAKFIPLLTERMYATNPYTRMFLVSWLRLLDSIPDLEFISYLPFFFEPLISYLNAPFDDARVVTSTFLSLLLQEIKRIADIQKFVAAERQKRLEAMTLSSENGNANNNQSAVDQESGDLNQPSTIPGGLNTGTGTPLENSMNISDDGFYIPGQDIIIDYPKIIDVLISCLDSSKEAIQLMSLQWLQTMLEILSIDFIKFLPKLLSILLQTISHTNAQIKSSANVLNASLMSLAKSIPPKEYESSEFNYTLVLNQLTLQFSNDKESTRLAALDWLIMIHDKNPKKMLELSDIIFTTLLKTLNDPSNLVINKDLELLAKISNESDDNYFELFMVDLLNLFRKDRKLLDTKADFIIRTICESLSAERVYTALAKVLETETNLTFASIMIQILNNNLITAFELSKLRKKVSATPSTDLFRVLFKSWCHNPPAALCLCLFSQNEELAYSIVELLAEYEMTVSTLIQIDVLVQLLESPVFSKLRLKLLNPHKNPYLYKCLYGILMLLPQSSAFVTLNNRLSSIAPMTLLPFNKEAGNDQKDSSPFKASNSEFGDLLEHFSKIQKSHEENRVSTAKERLNSNNLAKNMSNLKSSKYSNHKEKDLPLDSSSVIMNNNSLQKPQSSNDIVRKLSGKMSKTTL